MSTEPIIISIAIKYNPALTEYPLYNTEVRISCEFETSDSLATIQYIH